MKKRESRGILHKRISSPKGHTNPKCMWQNVEMKGEIYKSTNMLQNFLAPLSNQWNTRTGCLQDTEDQNTIQQTDSHKWGELTLAKAPREFKGEREVFSTNSAETTGRPYAKK